MDRKKSSTDSHIHAHLIVCRECGGGVCGSCGECAVCGHAVRVEDGVVCLLERSDSFYEGTYRAQIHFDEQSRQTLFGRLALPFINHGYLKKIVEHVTPRSRVLELGCGSGIQLAGERYEVSAVDLSQLSVAGTPVTYRHRVQADVLEIDFLPGSFDAVIASCFFEHFTPAQKKRLLTRIHRWLRPGGRLILFFDTESHNPLFRWFRKFPDLYQRCFVEHDGHVGLESVSKNQQHFLDQGFIEIFGIGINRTIQHLPVYTWMLPYQREAAWVSKVSRLGDIVGRNVLLTRAFAVAIQLWDQSLGRFFPLDWSRLYIGVWTRP